MKNSYLGFFVWIIGYIALLFSSNFLTDNISWVVLWIENVSFIMMTVLMGIIYKTGNIHWFSGIDIQESLKYTDVQKKVYSKACLILFGKATCFFLMYTILALVLSIPFWMHVLVFIFTLIGTVIFSMKIKLGA